MIKPRHKRRLFWLVLSIIGVFALSVVIVPPLISLNNMKPKLENTILQQTGFAVNINGNVNFSLLGHLTISAHDVHTPNGNIESVQFSIPITKIFNPESANLSGKIFVFGANLKISDLKPPKFDGEIELYDSKINFMNKDYEIVSGTLHNGLLSGSVRTNDHKYEFDSNGDEFHISNKNNDLEIYGRLYSDGTAKGTFSINTTNINEFFEFSEPKINRPVKMTMNFEWNGNYGFKFSEIRGGDFTGAINLFDDGSREITILSDNTDYDLSFLLKETKLFFNTKLNIDLNGNLKMGDKVYKHLKIDAIGQKSGIKINKLIADDIEISGGLITGDGAEKLPLDLIFDGVNTNCLFSGSVDNWKCDNFSHGDFSGNLSVKNGVFEILVKSDKNMPTKADFLKKLRLIGPDGHVVFNFADSNGTIDIKNYEIDPHYEFAKNKTLSWYNVDLYFLPESMLNETGNFTWTSKDFTFIPDSKKWKLTLGKDYFFISGDSIKSWFPNKDFPFLKDTSYAVSGNYHDKNISKLEIKIADHVFTGSVIGKDITLKTDMLNIDSFTNQSFMDNFGELQFLNQEPIITPFNLGLNISLHADKFIYNGNEFKNFYYSLKQDTQAFSISDDMRGNLLATIKRDQNKYNIVLQLNKFAISGNLLSDTPLNISDTLITAQANLSTSGKIGYDIRKNLSGDIDISFTDGMITGIGTDNFYANISNISTLNAEYAISDAISKGTSRLKKMRIVGTYNNGNFATTSPFMLSMHHADAAGDLEINNKKMFVDMNLLLRGTAPVPVPIAIKVLPNGKHNFSLSEIMKTFDPDFMRDFTKTHDQF